jgi:hypothetical protein
MSVKIEYSDYVESRPPAESVDGSELLAVSKDGEAVQLTAAQIASLSPGVSDGDKGDVIVSGFGTVWETKNFVQAVVDSTGSTITLNFQSKISGNFSASTSFGVPREVILTNTDRAWKYEFNFEVTAEDVPIDFGPNARSTHPDFHGGIMYPADIGLWKVTGTRRYGTDIWMLDFNGVYSVGDAPPEPPDPGDSWVIGSGIWNDSAVWKDTGIWKDNP